MKTITVRTKTGRRFAWGLLLFLLLFAAVPMAVGVGLLYLRHQAISTRAAAQSWQEVACVVEVCEMKTSDDEDYLDFVFAYEIDGQPYRSDRLDAVIGRFGDDDLFEESIFESFPPGAHARCFVNPNDPTEAIFDREHGADAPRRLFLLAFPFVTVGLLFSMLFLAALLIPDRMATVENHHERVRTFFRDQSPPRRLPLATRLAVMAGPASSQLAWLFLVGFVFVFVIMDGPRQWAQLFNISGSQRTVTGVVADVRQIDAHELNMPVYQYVVEYEWDELEFEIINYMRGRRYDENDAVPVRINPETPNAGRLVGARQSELTWWHSAIPLGVIVLLVFGILAMYLHGYRTAKLLRNGVWINAGTLAGAFESEATGQEPATLRSRYSIQINGEYYSALHFAPSGKKKRTTDVAVLYDASRPQRNIILDSVLCDTVVAAESLSGMLQQCIVVPVALVAMTILVLGAF